MNRKKNIILGLFATGITGALLSSLAIAQVPTAKPLPTAKPPLPVLNMPKVTSWGGTWSRDTNVKVQVGISSGGTGTKGKVTVQRGAQNSVKTFDLPANKTATIEVPALGTGCASVEYYTVKVEGTNNLKGQKLMEMGTGQLRESAGPI